MLLAYKLTENDWINARKLHFDCRKPKKSLLKTVQLFAVNNCYKSCFFASKAMLNKQRFAADLAKN